MFQIASVASCLKTMYLREESSSVFTLLFREKAEDSNKISP